eukprot:Partr_v1_DN26707_c1_g1_i6_m8285 putative Phosphopantothenoylcysteine decarboxylase
MEETVKILLGLTGSVASIKVYELIIDLRRVHAEQGKRALIQLLATKNALHFINGLDSTQFPSITIVKNPPQVDPVFESGNEVPLWLDDDEWTNWRGRGDIVLHIELRKWCDLIVVAPLDANTLSKVANGLCDNLLTCVLRAWDMNMDKRVILCPAMNSYMWMHPVTSEA